MDEQHPLDPPPSDCIGVQQGFDMEQYESHTEQCKLSVLRALYERLANQQRIPVGIVEAGWFYRHESERTHVVIRMRVPTAPLLMDYAEHVEEES